MHLLERKIDDLELRKRLSREAFETLLSLILFSLFAMSSKFYELLRHCKYFTCTMRYIFKLLPGEFLGIVSSRPILRFRMQFYRENHMNNKIKISIGKEDPVINFLSHGLIIVRVTSLALAEKCISQNRGNYKRVQFLDCTYDYIYST